MNIEIPRTLKELGKIFQANNSPLFLVGGYIRNSLLGFIETDMDICSSLHYEKVIEILRGSIFDTKVINQKLGTVLIKSKVSEEEFEYTTWRKESYSMGGVHSPEDVQFVKNIEEDAKRRDFTCNAIYYDINKGEILDFCGGVQDTLMHTLKTVNAPQITFDDDGLRILRLVRMSSELDFNIDPDCFLVAKEKVGNLKDISGERFNKEIVSILFADFKYDAIKNLHTQTKGVNELCSLGAFGYIFRGLALKMGVENLNKKLQKPWVFNLSIAPAIHRISVFTYEILKALELEISHENVDEILGQNGLMLSKKQVLKQSKILLGLEEIKNLQTDNQRKEFILKNNENIARILDLAQIFGIGQAERSVWKILKLDNTPLCIKDLKISGKDIENNFPNIKKEKYGQILDGLLQRCLFVPELNTKQNLLKEIKENFKC